MDTFGTAATADKLESKTPSRSFPGIYRRSVEEPKKSAYFEHDPILNRALGLRKEGHLTSEEFQAIAGIRAAKHGADFEDFQRMVR